MFRDAKTVEPDLLADKVHLLTEGARIATQCWRVIDGPGSRIQETLQTTIADHIKPRVSANTSAMRRRSNSCNKTVTRRPSTALHEQVLMPNLPIFSDASPRERILATAADLFWRHSIRAVSVGAIAKAAGTNKMTLYYHFESKDALVAEYLRRLVSVSEQQWIQTRQAFPDPWECIQALLTGVHDLVENRNSPGCAFAQAGIEIRDTNQMARAIIEGRKEGFLKRLVELFTDAKMANPSYLADITALIVEGGRISALCCGPDGPALRVTPILAEIYEDYANRG
jgi:AcrR family transcriptional regulator